MVENLVGNNRFTNVEQEGETVIITINNPPVNVLNEELLKELNEIFNALAQNPDIRAAIITGAGEKAFVAGADIKDFTDLNPVSGEAFVLRGHSIFNKIGKLRIPVICALNGFTLGGGCELALACDIRIAAMNAKIGLPEVGLGIIPGYGGTQRMARLVGVGKAMELIFSGEAVSAEEAYRIGLVEKLVPVGEALQSAKELARTISLRGPLAIEKAKIAINKGIEMELQKGLQLEATLFGEICATEDKNEGAKAFMEKRSPKFVGK